MKGKVSRIPANFKCKCIHYKCIHYKTENGIRYFFHSGERGHGKKHVHALYQGSEATFGLEPVEQLQGELRPRKKQTEALEFVMANHKNLLAYWDAFVLGDVQVSSKRFKNRSKIPYSFRWVRGYSKNRKFR